MCHILGVLGGYCSVTSNNLFKHVYISVHFHQENGDISVECLHKSEQASICAWKAGVKYYCLALLGPTLNRRVSLPPQPRACAVYVSSPVLWPKYMQLSNISVSCIAALLWVSDTCRHRWVVFDVVDVNFDMKSFSDVENKMLTYWSFVINFSSIKRSQLPVLIEHSDTLHHTAVGMNIYN